MKSLWNSFSAFRFPRPRSDRRALCRGRRLRAEHLEPRQLLATDLALNDLVLVNAAGQDAEPPVWGQRTYVRAEFTMRDLSPSDRFVVEFAVGESKVHSATIEGISGAAVPFSWFHGGWVATQTPLHITVTVDAENAIAESNEQNNTRSISITAVPPDSLPSRFVTPIAGAQNRDWVIDSYVDVDPSFGTEDYLGRNSAGPGHHGLDVRLANFAAMDRGVDVLAAAAGTVVEVRDGAFDRQTSQQFPFPPDNLVAIDHGHGWQTRYQHLRRDSITVREGDTVAPGQTLGLVGSAGNSGAPHLHFELLYEGSPVEPFVAPETYWVEPLPYTLAAPKALLDFGVTDEAPLFEHIQERVSDIDGFASSPFLNVYVWAIFTSLEVGDTWQVRFYRPDGTLHAADAPAVITADRPYEWFWWIGILPESPDVGQWRADWHINGQKLGEHSFTVGIPRPEIRVLHGETLIIDGRTTPIDFGEGELVRPGRLQVFEVENHGDAPLETSGVDLPLGYALVEGLDATIAPSGSDTFSVRLETAAPGDYTGQVVVHSNDVSEPTIAFAVEGRVSGGPPIPADFDADGDVDDDDFLRWQAGWGITMGAAKSQGDANGDTDVDGDDFLEWQRSRTDRLESGGRGAGISRPSTSSSPDTAKRAARLHLSERLAKKAAPAQTKRFYTEPRDLAFEDASAWRLI